MRFDIPSPRISWQPARTYGRSKKCLGTRVSQQPRYTPQWKHPACFITTPSFIPGKLAETRPPIVVKIGIHQVLMSDHRLRVAQPQLVTTGRKIYLGVAKKNT